MLFSKKWPKNHPKFLLHFLIHIDVFMLCSKFELFPTNIFQVMAILRNLPISEKYPRLLLLLLLLLLINFTIHTTNVTKIIRNKKNKKEKKEMYRR